MDEKRLEELKGMIILMLCEGESYPVRVDNTRMIMLPMKNSLVDREVWREITGGLPPAGAFARYGLNVIRRDILPKLAGGERKEELNAIKAFNFILKYAEGAGVKSILAANPMDLVRGPSVASLPCGEVTNS